MKKIYLPILILMLVIGFAAVTTNLVINGTINFGFNNEDFDSNVVFTYAKAKNGEANITADNKKTITFETIKLENINQEAILEYDIANKSLQYDASVIITCGLEEASKPYEQYLKIHNSIEGKFELKSGETKTGYLTVTLIKAYNESLTKDVNMLCTIEATPGGRETEGTYTPVEHQEYEELILKGADPVLEGTGETATTNKKLIPVEISDGGLVTRADTTKKWYSYENKKWANAVILVDGKEDPGANQTIQEQDIESYFVWIPKYSYKLFDMGDYKTATNVQDKSNNAVEIHFGLNDTNDNNSDECTTPGKSGESGSCTLNDWMTHPAFLAFNSNGLWVGKFETGYKGAINTTGARQNNSNSSNIVIKPNQYSWASITVGNIFKASKSYKSTLVSHMMKNTEWGAVAYLTQSLYGICSNNGSETTCTEVAKNNHSSYKTGYYSTNVAYPNSQAASTTGNNTGIFDMNGDTWEYMASVMESTSGSKTPQLTNSGLTISDLSDNRYYDLYNYGTTEAGWHRRILGDATGEMGPFALVSGSTYRSSINSNRANFVRNSIPWFGRGGGVLDGMTNSVDGIFYFGRMAGNGGLNSSNYGFRIVLAPTIS